LAVQSADPVVEHSKAVVIAFFDALSESRFDDAFALTDPSGVIHLPSPRQTLVLPRWREVYEALMESQFPEGCRYEVGPLIGEGANVAVITESFALMRTGSLYNNLYHWLFHLEGGRIVEIHEFMDSLYAHRTIHAAGWKGRRGDDG
jgi:ketosteroid isomerase-like protein